jgi:hypothetical protein
MEERLFLTGVLLPACAAVAVALLLGRHRMRWMGMALATAFVVSAIDQQGGWNWPRPREWTWLVIAIVSASVVGAAAGHDACTRGARGIVCILAACLASLLLPLPGWLDAGARLALAACGAAGAAWLLPLGMHRGGFSSWLCRSVAIAAPSVVALSCGFAKLAVSLGALSAACGGMGVAAVCLRRPLHAGISGSLVIALACTLGSAAAHAFDSLQTPGWVFAVAAAAPLGAWLGEAPPFRATTLVSALARLTGVAVITAIAVWAVAPRLASDGETDAYALLGESPPTSSILSPR